MMIKVCFQFLSQGENNMSLSINEFQSGHQKRNCKIVITYVILIKDCPEQHNASSQIVRPQSTVRITRQWSSSKRGVVTMKEIMQNPTQNPSQHSKKQKTSVLQCCWPFWSMAPWLLRYVQNFNDRKDINGKLYQSEFAMYVLWISVTT